MASYAVSDVAFILRERDWKDWDELLTWLEQQPVDPTRGLSASDRSELLEDLGRLRDEGRPLIREPGELYREAMALSELRAPRSDS